MPLSKLKPGSEAHDVLTGTVWKEDTLRGALTKELVAGLAAVAAFPVVIVALPIILVAQHVQDNLDTKAFKEGKEKVTGANRYENTAPPKGFNLSDASLNTMQFVHGKVDPKTGLLDAGPSRTALIESTGVTALRRDLLQATVAVMYGATRDAYKPVVEWLAKAPVDRVRDIATIDPYYDFLAKQLNGKGIFAGDPPASTITSDNIKALAQYIPNDTSLTVYDALSAAIEAEAAARVAAGGVSPTPVLPLLELKAEVDLTAEAKAALTEIKKDFAVVKAIDGISRFAAPPSDPAEKAKLSQLETEAKALPSSKAAEAEKAFTAAAKGNGATLKERIEVDLVVLNRLHQQKTAISTGLNADGSPRTPAPTSTDQAQAKIDLKEIENSIALMRSWYLQLQGNEPVVRERNWAAKGLDFVLGIQTNTNHTHTEKHGLSNIKSYAFNIADIEIEDPANKGQFITKAGGISCRTRVTSPRMAEDMGMTIISLAIKKGIPHPTEKGFELTLRDGFSESKLRSLLESKNPGDKRELENNLHLIATMKLLGEAVGITMHKPPSWQRNQGVNAHFEEAMKNVKVTFDQLAKDKFGPSSKFDSLQPLQRVALVQEELKLKDHEMEPYLRSMLANDPSIGRTPEQALSDIQHIMEAATPEEASSVDVGADVPEERTRLR